LASLGVSLDGRGSCQGDSVDCEPRHCASKDTISELDLAHVCKCVLGRQQGYATLWAHEDLIESSLSLHFA